MDQFSELYEKNGKIWLTKLFSGQLLAALLRDMKDYTNDSMDARISQDILDALRTAKKLVDDIPDGNFFYESFSNLIDEFIRLFIKWSNAEGKENKQERIKFRTLLINIRNEMNRSINVTMEGIRSGSTSNRERNLERMRNLDRGRIEELRSVFKDVLARTPLNELNDLRQENNKLNGK